MVRPFVVLTAAFGAIAAAAMPVPASDRIGADQLRAHIAVLADDSFEGRRPGTLGGEKTEAWLQRAFADAGLRPAAPDGSWRQEFAIVERQPRGTTLQTHGNGRPQAVANDAIGAIGWQPDDRIAGAPLWYVGAGESARLDAIDLRGAIVVATLDRGRDTRDLAERRADLVRRGAAATLFAVPQDRWAAFRDDLARGRRGLTGDGGRPDGLIADTAARALFGLRRLDPAAAPRRAKGVADLAVRTELRTFDTANIVGRIPGRDPAAGAVLLSAHWDHLGLCRPADAPDRICNGANDNASGTAMLVEIARRLAAGPHPVRDVYILATSAEEMGMLGANAFADAPPVPLSSIVAALNLDTAAIVPAGAPVAMIGRGRTPALDRVVDDVTRRAGRRVDADDEAGVMIARQDGWAFARRGVPAVMVSGSFSDMKGLMAYLAGTYHGPDDDLAHLADMSGAAEDATLHVALARALADPATYPAPVREK